jgi:uncharacterized protein YdeI (YjbR/CyaY-like superfamily)
MTTASGRARLGKSKAASMATQPLFFETPAAFRAWLKEHHRTETELHVGFVKKHTGKPSLTWPESVAQALCFGWIDGIRRRLDDERYVIRFTPRRPGSNWSSVNIRLVQQLEAAGRMTTLDEARIKAFRKHKTAWRFFETQPPGYRRMAAWWVMQAKQEETRNRRLRKLIEISSAGERLR